MHSVSTYRCDDIKNFFSISEHVKHGRQLTKVLCKCPIPNKMASYSEQLTQHNTNYFASIRYLNSCKLFNSKNICQIIHYTSEIIYSVGIRNVSVPRLSFSHFLCTTMMESNIRNDVNDIFTIKLQN